MPETFCEIERFRFADVVRHWARERLVHELVVARELARGVIRDGLRFQSVDPKWTRATEVLRGEPLVGYSAHQTAPPVMIRENALAHLHAVAAETQDADYRRLAREYVTKDDFRKWLVATGRAMPGFWFDVNERHSPREDTPPAPAGR